MSRKTLMDQCTIAERWWLGKWVRRRRSDKPFARCVGVELCGPPSGWTWVATLRLEDRTFATGDRSRIGKGKWTSTLTAVRKSDIAVMEKEL